MSTAAAVPETRGLEGEDADRDRSETSGVPQLIR